jgi:hypothetical protein
VESNFNAVICAEASEGLYYGMLSDDVWRTHSVQVVPLLTEDALHDIAHTYLAVPLSKQYIEELQNRPDAANTQGARDGLESHARDFDKVRYWMFRIEKRGRFVLLVDLLLGRPRLPPGIDIDRGLAAMKSEAPKDRH